MMSLLVKEEGHLDIEADKDEGSVKTEADNGIMLPHSEKCQEPLEAGEGQERMSPKGFGESVALPMP